MLEVGVVVEVGNVDAGPGRGVGSLQGDQLPQLVPPQVLLGRRTEKKE